MVLASDFYSKKGGSFKQKVKSKSRKILLVEDDLLCQNIIGGMLKQNDFQVITVDSGVEALNICLKEVELILLDIMMPGINGITIAQSVRENEQFQQIPIIFITECREASIVQACFEVGAQAILNKPLEEKELINCIRFWLCENEVTAIPLLNAQEMAYSCYEMIKYLHDTAGYSYSRIAMRMGVSASTIQKCHMIKGRVLRWKNFYQLMLLYCRVFFGDFRTFEFAREIDADLQRYINCLPRQFRAYYKTFARRSTTVSLGGLMALVDEMGSA